MKVLFQSRSTLFTVPGGDTVQIVKTKEAVQDLGVRCHISTELEPDLSGYDLVHLFNLTRPQEIYCQARNAKKRNRKVVLSTIYVSYREYDVRARGGMFGMIARSLNEGRTEYLKILARAVKNREAGKGTWMVLSRGFRRLEREILCMSDLLLPNSESEMRRVIRDFPEAEGMRYAVVPNAVDEEIFDPVRVELSADMDRYRGAILCVGRIEGLKNQLNLVRAARSLGRPIVLIGKPAPNHLSYYRKILEEAGSSVHLVGPVDHTALPQYYKAAKVHALPSWMETTGLSSLEAGAMGCNLVITGKGDTRDYFDDLAFYCEPDSIESIRAALAKACASPADPALRKHILDRFTWKKAAEMTASAYRIALNEADHA